MEEAVEVSVVVVGVVMEEEAVVTQSHVVGKTNGLSSSWLLG